MSETKRKIFIIIVLLLVVVFGIGQFFTQGLTPTTPAPAANPNPTNNNQPTTQVVTYVPPTFAPGTPVEKGSCFASSIAAPYRTDAWRCTVGNAISDPCFEVPGATSTLACGENPATTDISSVFELQLTKPLPKPDVTSGTIPNNWAWMIELTDGTICTPFTGTRPFSATGEVATYSCNGGPDKNMIFGDLISTSTIWTAELGGLSVATSTFPPAIVASTTASVFAVWQ